MHRSLSFSLRMAAGLALGALWLGGLGTAGGDRAWAQPDSGGLSVGVNDVQEPPTMQSGELESPPTEGTLAGSSQGAAAAAEPEAAADAGSAAVTGLRADAPAGRPRVRIFLTGRVNSQVSYFVKPDRVLVKLSGAVLRTKQRTLEAGPSPLQRIRAAQHGRDAWVVLDVDRPGKWQRRQKAHELDVWPAGAAAPAEAETRPAAGETAEPPAKGEGASESPSYRVLDVATEDTGELTRVMITTDGPVRYKVMHEKPGDILTVAVYGASLSWNPRSAKLAKGAVAKISALSERLDGEPAVKIIIRMTAPVPYMVYKDQNQVIVELNNPVPSSSGVPTRGSLRTRVSVDFQNADLLSVLRALSQDVGFDLVLTPGGQEPAGEPNQVTITINEQPLANVLDLLLRPRKMAFEISGNTLRVGLAADFPTDTRIFTLKNFEAKNSNLRESLEAALTEGTHSKVIVDPASNRVIVTAIPSDLIKMEGIIAGLDTPSRLQTRSIILSYAEPGKLAPLLRPMLSSIASLEINDRENALVITDIPGNLARLTSLARSLDKPTKQVMIEARMVEVAVSNEVDLGVNWGISRHDPAANPNITISSAPDAVGAVGKLTLGSLNANIDLTAAISALEAKGAANMISNPRIATLDNQSATLSATQNIPYATSYVSNGVVKSGVEYLELPITLTVTPHISKDRQVLLSPTTLTVTTITTPGSPPQTSTRSASTQMQVVDGETVAIGGMIRDTQTTKESKIPLLGDIPLLGFFFRSTTEAKEKVELVVFLTPHILE